MAFEKGTKYDKIINEDFDNAYLAIFDQPEYDDSINIHLNIDVFEHYTIPEKWADDYVKILQGEYSELSKEYKQHLLDFWNNDETSLLYAVLHSLKERFKDRTIEVNNRIKFSKLKELWPPLKLDKEIYGMGAI